MYADIGGMDIQKQEVREAVELPLTHFELYKQVCMSVFVSVLSYLQLIGRSSKCFKLCFTIFALSIQPFVWPVCP